MKKIKEEIKNFIQEHIAPETVFPLFGIAVVIWMVYAMIAA